MRQVLSLLLVSILTFHAVPVSAQEVDSNPTLEERLLNMDAEVERFLQLNTSKSDGLILEQETPATDESTDEERVRARLLRLKPKTEIGVILRDGETVKGQLAEIADDSFWLWAETSESRKAHREYRFDEVKSLLYPGSPEKVHEIPAGKRIEVVLLNGEKIRGRLLSTSERRFTLSIYSIWDDREAEKKETREFSFHEVLSVRKLGMRTEYKVLIGVGVVVVVLGFLVGWSLDR